MSDLSKSPRSDPFTSLGVRGLCAKEPRWGTRQGLQCSAGQDGRYAAGKCISGMGYTRGSVLYVHALRCAWGAAGPYVPRVPHSQSTGSCWSSHRDRNVGGGNTMGNCSWSCCSTETTGVNMLFYILKGQQIYFSPLRWIEINREYRNPFAPFAVIFNLQKLQSF